MTYATKRELAPGPSPRSLWRQQTTQKRRLGRWRTDVHKIHPLSNNETNLERKKLQHATLTAPRTERETNLERNCDTQPSLPLVRREIAPAQASDQTHFHDHVLCTLPPCVESTTVLASDRGTIGHRSHPFHGDKCSANEASTFFSRCFRQLAQGASLHVYIT